MIKALWSDKLILFLICLVSGVFYFHGWLSMGRGYFWDFKAYEAAVLKFSNGDNPYQNSEFLFVYHPYVIYIFTALNRLISIRTALFPVYALVSLFAFVELYKFIEISETVKEKKGFLLLNVAFIIFVSLCFGDAGSLSILSGNVSTFIHLWLFFLVIRYERKKGNVMPWVFAFSVLVAAMIKPYFLAYFLFGGIFWGREKWAMIFAAVLFVVSCLWLSAFWVVPDLYRGFESALHEQVLNRGKADLGYSFFGILKPIVDDVKVALVLHGTVMIFLSYFLLFWLPENTANGQAQHLKVFLLAPIVVFSNPRMMGYDFPIAVLSWLVYMYLVDVKHYAKVAMSGVLIALVPIKYYVERKLHLSSSPAPLFETTYWQIIAFALMLMVYVWKNSKDYKLAKLHSI